MTVKSKLIQHCGLCARYTRNGENVPSGNRDPETGITPMDNFVCWRCQSKAPGASILMGKPAEMADGTSASNRTGVSRFVTRDFAVQRHFSAASTLQNKRCAQNGSEKHFNKAITQSSRRASLRKLLMLQPDLSKTTHQSA